MLKIIKFVKERFEVMGALKEIQPIKTGLKGEILIPGDKSVSHRSVMFAGLCDSEVKITNFLHAADCMSTVNCMRALGVKVKELDENTLIVKGNGFHGLQEPQSIIDAGNSGTTLRLMMGILAGQKFLTTFTGDASLSRRPMGRVINPLSQMGANIVGRKENKLLPITVIPAKENLQGIDYQMPMASAQVKSAILLAGMNAEGRTTVTEPYTSRDHTERMLEGFGVKLEKSGTSITISKVEKMTAPKEIHVPGDISSAAFWLVAGSIIEDSDIILKDVGINETRTGIIDVLKAMGANIELLNVRDEVEPIADIRVRYAKLHGTSFGADIMPRLIDEIPIITVASMFAEGETIITGAGELRVKETDRLQVITDEFNKVCPCIKGTQDGLIITGSQRNNLQKVVCNSHDDHRIAMALAILGASGVGIEIENSECVNISYPTFYEILTRFE
jgi:3-phosphoshikimate 1-carboxyvinyltransferase